MRNTPTNRPLRAATFLLASVGSVVAASHVRAQEASPETPAAVSTELDRKRLLTLEDGTVLRVRSRTQDGVWQQRVGRDWLPLAQRVVGHRLEREVLAEARRLERPIKRNDHGQRAELARWLAQQGLHPEAISQLDRILGAEPEHEDALRVVSETPIALELPPEAERDLALRLKALVKTGASGSRATREVAVHQLRELGVSERGERVDLRRVIEVELTAPQYRRRQFAAFAARRLYPGEMRKRLATRSILDGWEAVREEASSALRDAEDVSVIGSALYALGSGNVNVRANAAAALGSMGYEAAVQPLMNHLAAAVQNSGGAPTGTRANLLVGLQTAYVMDFDVEIAQAASIADPIIGIQASGVIFDVRTTVQISRVVELRTVMHSLRRLTGQNIPDSAERWQAWWEEHGSEWQALDRARQYMAERDKTAQVGD